MSQSQYSTVLIAWLVQASLMSASALAGHSFNLGSKGSKHDSSSNGEVLARIAATSESWRHSASNLKSAKSSQPVDPFASPVEKCATPTPDWRHLLSDGTGLIRSGLKLQV